MSCPICGEPYITIDHWEYDGFDGSYEPYTECLNGHKPVDEWEMEDYLLYCEENGIEPKQWVKNWTRQLLEAK